MAGNSSIFPSELSSVHLRVIKTPEKIRRFVDAKTHYLVAKRTIDIILAVLVIVCILSWLTPLLLLVICIDSSGPLFFVQKRVGRGGKSFSCFKFRTMCLNLEKDERAAAENDERITRVGSILRKLNIDELPQFVNVLTGQMSVIGPRPHMFADFNRFSAVVPAYKFRSMVKPGLTGLAQIKGYRGPANDQQSIAMRYYWDVHYVKNISLWLDCRILFTTVKQRFSSVLLPSSSPLIVSETQKGFGTKFQ